MDGNAQYADYVLMGDIDKLKLRTHDLSFSIWLNTVDATVQGVIGQGNPFNNNGSGYDLLYRGDTNTLDVRINNGSGLPQSVAYTHTPGLEDGAWHHVVVTIDNTGVYNEGDVEYIKIYLDGNPTPVVSATNTKVGPDITGTSGFIGGALTGGGTAYFQGYLDDLRVFHDVLSAADVAELGRTQEALYTTSRRVDYTYDAFDRRIKKAIDDNNDGDYNDTNEAIWQFVYDGDDIVLAFDKDNNLKNRYLHGPAVDQILADEQVSNLSNAGTVYWPLADRLGSIRDITDSNGGVVRHTVFDAFGMVHSQTGTLASFIYGFTGRERDSESHLQYNRARYYDARIGRWISQDPASFNAGDENLYRYVANSPTNDIDPSGEAGFWKSIGNAIKSGIDKLRNAINKGLEKLKQAVDEVVKVGKQFFRDARKGISTALDFVPVVSAVKASVEVATGKDYIAGVELCEWERAIAAAGVVPGGKLIKHFIKGGGALADLVRAARRTDRLADTARGADRMADTGRAADGAGGAGRRGGGAAGGGSRAGRA